MKKLSLGCLGLIVFLISLVTIWVQFPQQTHPQLIEETVAKAQERHRSRQATARNPKFNGYLQPTLLPFWGTPADYKPNSGVEKVITRWKAYGSNSQGTRQDHRALLSQVDYLAARDQFESLLPALEEALNQSEFIAPNDRFDYIDNNDMKFISVRALGQALATLAESRVAEGQPEKALRPLALGFKLGAKLDQQGTLLSLFIGFNVNKVSAQAAQGLLRPETELSPEHWRALADAVVQGSPPPNLLETAIEDEIGRTFNTFRLFNTDPTTLIDFGGDGLVYKLPGMLAREERICFNQWATTLTALRQKQPLVPPAPSMSTIREWLRGTAGLLGDGFLTNYSRPQALVDFHRQELTGLAVSAALLSERAATGRFPNDLSALKLKLPMENLVWDREQEQLVVSFDSQINALLPRQKLDLYTHKPWVRLKDSTLIYNLKKI